MNKRKKKSKKPIETTKDPLKQGLLANAVH